MDNLFVGSRRRMTVVVACVVVCVLAAFLVWPRLDLAVSGTFADGAKGFYLVHVKPLIILSRVAYWGSRLLGLAFIGGGIAALVARRPVFGLSAKSWIFLLVTLLVGPGLVANVVFKDNWGRARPRTVVEFGGPAVYTPPFALSDACKKNCSFVSGDAAFGAFLLAFAYVVPAKRRRRVAVSMALAGSVFGLARVVSGAHFLSDVLFGAVFILLTTALCHALLFGRAATKAVWASWFSDP